MVLILKQSFPLLLAALILATAPGTTNGAARGIRGRQNGQLNSLAVSGDDSNMDFSERRLKKGKSKKCKGKHKTNCAQPSGAALLDVVAGRLDLPADPVETDPTPPKPALGSWVEGCSSQNLDLNSCAFDTSFLCKNCLYALSFTSATPETATGGVKACQRNFCSSCTEGEPMAFFDCGYKISHPMSETQIDDSALPDSPPTNDTNASVAPAVATNATVAPLIDETVYDMKNCPSIYPRSGTNCVMIPGFEFKKCFYFEVGPSVVCDCSEDDPVWNCTGEIRNEDYIVEEEEDLQVPIKPLPSNDVVVSRIDNSYTLCPEATPLIGHPCNTYDFASIECCYVDPEPLPDTLGTITCTCSNGGSEGFWCKGGSLSTCSLP